jgi:hypothetical protein
LSVALSARIEIRRENRRLRRRKAGAGRRMSRGKARGKIGKFQRNHQEMADPEYEDNRDGS